MTNEKKKEIEYGREDDYVPKVYMNVHILGIRTRLHTTQTRHRTDVHSTAHSRHEPHIRTLTHRRGYEMDDVARLHTYTTRL